MATVNINGFDNLQRRLTDISEMNIQNSIKKATVAVQAQAKLLAPVDTGQLRNSIHATVTINGAKTIGKVYSKLDYAVYNEFGTGQRGKASNIERHENVAYTENWAGMVAQPFMYPALKKSRKYISNVIKTEVKAIIKGDN